VAALLLVVAALPILIQLGPAMGALLGGRTLLAFVLFAVIGVAVGHLLGGDDPGFQTVLAVSTPSRHPALAAAVAAAARPELEGIFPAAVLYLLVSIVVTGVYVARRKKLDGPAAA
jgi:BASS family bile acid:Na+ symporter